MIRARVMWGGPVVTGGGISTLYSTNDVGDAQDFIDGIEQFLNGIADRLNNNLTMQCENTVDEVDIATGDIISQTAVSAALIIGTDATEALPIATQGLVQARTGVFLGGREIRGRIFVPAFTETASSGGTPSSACKTDVNTQAGNFAADAAANWCVYSRTHHAAAGVTSATMWSQWAVLRSRRD